MSSCAYKSTHPDVLAFFEYLISNTWYHDAIAIARDNGLADVDAVAQSHFGPAGYKPVPEGDLPKGWRVEARQGFVVPDKRLKVGKAIGAAMDALGPHPDVRGIPGQPPEVWVSKGGDGRGRFTHNILYPEAFTRDGVAWVKWGVEADYVESEKRDMAMGALDPAMWSRAKLSEYHLALEAHEAAVEAEKSVA